MECVWGERGLKGPPVRTGRLTGRSKPRDIPRKAPQARCCVINARRRLANPAARRTGVPERPGGGGSGGGAAASGHLVCHPLLCTDRRMTAV